MVLFDGIHPCKLIHIVLLTPQPASSLLLRQIPPLTMWHEARRQEKKLRGLMVDYKKRAERRRNYYELCVSSHTLFVSEFPSPVHNVRLSS